jgi:hypothetical protein
MSLHSYPTSSHHEFKQKHLIIVIHLVHFVHTKYRTCTTSRRASTPQGKMENVYRQIWRDKEFLSLISGKFEWESPPSILVTRNPNWSHR